MADDKRQKVMLGVLALLVLGAGGYYFAFSEKDTGSAVANQDNAVRKKRVQADNTGRVAKKKRAQKAPETERSARKEREHTERKVSRKKRGRRGGPKKVVKRKFSPAA